MAAIRVSRATELLGNINDSQTRRQVRGDVFPPGVVFKLGHRLRFNEEALKEFIARGVVVSGQQSQPASASAQAA